MRWGVSVVVVVAAAGCAFTHGTASGQAASDGGRDSRVADASGSGFMDAPSTTGSGSATFDGTASTQATNTSTVSWTHTASGSHGLVIVGISWGSSNTSINNVSYGGTGMTLLGTEINTTKQLAVGMYRLVAPPTGAQTVTVTFDATISQVVAGSVSFSGVDQITPTGAFVGAAGGNPPPSPSVTVTSAANDLVFDTLVVDTNPSSVSPGTGQTQRWNISRSMWAAGSTKAGAASVTMTWTQNGGQDDWALGAVDVHGG